MPQVLITKLWSATNAETQQYRKASKALLVLIPLLGVTYVLVLMGPTEGQVANAFYYIRAVLLSSQVMQPGRVSRYKANTRTSSRVCTRRRFGVFVL